MSGAGRSAYDPTPEHEAACRRCGMSCHFAIEYAGESLIIPEIHCLFLGSEGAARICTVYERRFEEAPWCHTGVEALEKGLVGWDCPYAAGRSLPGGGKRWASPAQRAAVMPHVRKALIERGLERKYNPDAALRLLTADGESWTWRTEGEGYVFVRTPPQT